MKKPLSLILSLLILLSLTACKDETEPPATGDMSSPISYYANTDYQERCNFARGPFVEGIVYGNDLYFVDGALTLYSVSLPTRGSSQKSTGKVVCSDVMCDHSAQNGCPANLIDLYAQYVLDAAESAGEQPIFYYARATSFNPLFSGNNWERGTTNEVVRYDSGKGQTECLATVDYPIIQMMTYRDRVYFITQTSGNSSSIHTVKKTGGELTTVTPEDGYFYFIGANEERIYLNDSNGNVYENDLALGAMKLIYTVSEVYPMMAYTADLDMFIEGDYLYFFTDFEVHHFLYDPHDPDLYPESNDYDFIKRSIRRVKLDAPSGEGEPVADDVFQNSVYGVYGGKLYYGPFDVTTGHRTRDKQMQALNVSYSGGRVRCIDLDTLKAYDVISDSGFNFSQCNFYVSDRCLIGYACPYRNGMGLTYDGHGYAPNLLDFETGALYNVYNGYCYYDGTTAQ